jgi:Phosphotransferase enzyme family
MAGMSDAASLARALSALPGWRDFGADALEPLPDKGLAHQHWRIAGRGLLVRVPRSADADGALLRQATCFKRLAPCGRAPRLHAMVDPSPDLPGGALIVDEVVGGPPRLPAELSLIAETLAAIHALPLPAPADRPPLPSPAHPFIATLKTVEQNLRFLDRAAAEPDARRQIEEEVAWAQHFAADAAASDPGPCTLVVTDAHPGNFLVTAMGHAMFVDLEKGAYGSPAIDVAHATLRPSTRWDPDCGAVLSHEEIGRFARAYFTAIGPAMQQAIRPWLLPMRRLTWLRTTLAFARFRVERTAAPLAPAVAAHVEAVIADSLSAGTIDLVRREWMGPDALTF